MKIVKKNFGKDLPNRFQNTYKVCDAGLNKLCLMLLKCVYPHAYMDSWQEFNEMSLSGNKELHSSPKIEVITDVD